MSQDRIDWERTYAAIWRQQKEYLRPVRNIDPVRCDNLYSIDLQKEQLIQNTRMFLSGRPANNVLLWGARGTGKSSLVKAVFNDHKDQGLRLIEVDKFDLISLPEIVDHIQDVPRKFIVFCDDLSFDEGESSYKSLKSVLEGSIELPPDNILLYATSNRRHLLPELMKDNIHTRITEEEIHYTDAVEEKISLSDRFGLWLSFYPFSMDEYISIVDSYFAEYKGNRTELHEAARLFALSRASRSGRTAKQFYTHHRNILNTSQ